MAKSKKKPEIERQPGDGSVHITRESDQRIRIAITTNDVTETATMSEFNARRLLGVLSLMLDLPLSTAAAKRVMM